MKAIWRRDESLGTLMYESSDPIQQVCCSICIGNEPYRIRVEHTLAYTSHKYMRRIDRYKAPCPSRYSSTGPGWPDGSRNDSDHHE